MVAFTEEELTCIHRVTKKMIANSAFETDPIVKEYTKKVLKPVARKSKRMLKNKQFNNWVSRIMRINFPKKISKL